MTDTTNETKTAGVPTVVPPATGLSATLTPEQMAALYKASPTTDYSEEDLALPYLRILQSGSAELKRALPEFIDGAKEGEIFNIVTHERCDVLPVLVVKYVRRYTEWKPSRGALVKDHGADSSAYDACPVKGFGTRITAEGNEISATATYLVLALWPNGRPTRAIITMGGTQWKKARRLNTLVATLVLQGPQGEFVAPSHSRVYTLSTVPEKNDLGDWYGWKIEPDQLVYALPDGVNLFKMAEEFRQEIDEGKVQIGAPMQEDPSTDRQRGGDGGQGAAQSSAPKKDDDIPF